MRIRLNIWQFVLLSVVLILVFASFDEWRQGWTPGRHARLDTVFFDGVYATLGILLYSQIVFAILVVKKHHLRLRRNANTAEVWSNEKL